MIIISLIVYTVIISFYLTKVLKKDKTFKICMVLLMFSFIIQSLNILGYDLNSGTQKAVYFIENIVEGM